LLANRARLDPDAVAIEEVATGRTVSYRELDARAGRACTLLARRGIGPGDRVAILCRNRLAFWELLFACARAGAILAPLNWRMPAGELDLLIRDAEPGLLIYDEAFHQAAAALETQPPLLGLADYEAEAECLPESGERCPAAAETWYLLYTSGTTGRPKGVIYTFEMAVANLLNITAATGLRKRDAIPTFLPNFHTAGINLHALPALLTGGRLLLLESYDVDVLAGLLAEARADLLFGVPFIYQELIDHPLLRLAPLAQVRHWGCGGAPLPDRLAERYREVGIRLCNGMGMTETGPTALLMSPEDAWERLGSVGKLQLLCHARIVDAAGRPVAQGEVGELVFAGPGVTPGYWRNEEATRAAFTADGALLSGDLAWCDPDGFYYIVGRRKEMYISGGENVYPAEVEKVLTSHPAVSDAAVVAVPDERWGEVGQAFVQVAPGALLPDCSDLQSYCRSRLAAYKIPRAFAVVNDFPRTSAGKIQKHLLLS
ncbi:MAG TPA: AMP-binding protein, partial [Allosphingosinicella sp.]|nr:AMP-binding protein [Allosphingosinicella sp.]